MSRLAKYWRMRLPSEVAEEIHCGCPQPVEHDGFTYVQEVWELYDDTRWTLVHEFVVARTDPNGHLTYWFALIEQGKTENQDTNDFRDETEIEFYQVDKVPTVTYRYHPVLSAVD